MIIRFNNSKLEKIFNSEKLLRKKYGDKQIKIIMKRMFELDAAESLDDFRSLPQARCHELKGKRNGQLSVDLKHPYRLIFQPDHDPIPCKSDGGLDWTNVNSILILEVVDYHD